MVKHAQKIRRLWVNPQLSYLYKVDSTNENNGFGCLMASFLLLCRGLKNKTSVEMEKILKIFQS